ncbi:MAG: hypothetical protein ACRYG6_12730 [Janthinobacterium lividum]
MPLLRPLLVAVLLAGAVRAPAAAAQGFSMHPSDELSQPLRHHPRRPRPRPVQPRPQPPATPTPASPTPASPAAPPRTPLRP